jgi:branched-chain amino acid transport system ATP-binding protein
MLEVNDIVTAYGKIEALKGVSLSVPEGQITVLLGPNGAGKTTTLMTVAGLLKPKRGNVTFEGQDITSRQPGTIVQRGIALVPENRLVFPDMDVHDNLKTGAYVRNDNEIESDIEAIYERFPRLKERYHQHAGTLSGGEQQMLAVARALMARPKMMLMDEPSLGLAPMIVEEIFRIIHDLNQEGTSIFLVEQNAHMALQVAHQFYLLEQGLVTFSGTPGDMDENEVIQRAYLGTTS